MQAQTIVIDLNLFKAKKSLIRPLEKSKKLIG